MSEELLKGQRIGGFRPTQSPDLLFEAALSMMLALALYVAAKTLQLGSTDGEGRVARLPPEVDGTLLLHPARRVRLQLLFNFSMMEATLCVRPSECRMCT
jgi:hypothetical protein